MNEYIRPMNQNKLKTNTYTNYPFKHYIVAHNIASDKNQACNKSVNLNQTFPPPSPQKGK